MGEHRPADGLRPMTKAPSLEEILAVISAASAGNATVRVAVPAIPQLEHLPTRLAVALNALLDDLPGHAADAGGRSARLAAIVDASDDAIIGKTLTGEITSWNAGAARLFGYSAEEIVGQSILI